jgi:PEGA domain-containing protein
MGKINALFCMTVLGLFLTSCASVVSLVTEGGLDQEMKITSDPPGAQVFLMGSVPLGETPLLATKFERSKNTFLVVRKEGYDDQNILLKHRFNPWFWGNIICCGLLGSTTDSVNDSTIQFSPTQYHILLIQKNVSLEQTEQFARIKTARNLTLRGYSEVQQNLAVGDGEYLASLLVTLRVPESEQGDAIRQLQELMVVSKDPLEFSDKVLDSFHLSRL